jgi:tRNA nucleotidyltransferase/poly(A) polymerase
MEIPEKIFTMLKTLEFDGHYAYVVGGAVRDMLLGTEPKDWDIATSADPEQIKAAFAFRAEVKQIDAAFPVVVVDGVEIASYREDFYADGITTEVKRVETIEEDLARRDLTINAMAIDIQLNIIDPFNGQEHLKNGLICFVGDAGQRIHEDNCRVIRACRFVAALDGTFEQSTFIALRSAVRHNKIVISPERIRLEILKAMKYDRASKFFIALHHIEMLKDIFPALEKCFGADHGQYHDEDIFEHMMFTGDAVPGAINKVEVKFEHDEAVLLRLTGFLHDVGKTVPNYVKGAIHFYEHETVGVDILKEELKALKFSTPEIKFITNLTLIHMRGGCKMSPKSTRKLIKRFADVDVDWKHWLVIKCADRIGNIRRVDQPLRVVKIAKKFEHELEGTPYEKGPRDPNSPENAKPCFEHKQLAMSGTQIQQLLGIGPSQLIGVILEYLLKRVITDPSLNTNEQLTAIITGGMKK